MKNFIVLTATGILYGWLGGNVILLFSSNTDKDGIITSFIRRIYRNEISVNDINKCDNSSYGPNYRIFPIQPIITNLVDAPKHWIRLEIALICNDILDKSLLEFIQQDIIAYIRTVSIKQISGPQGFRYLKNDIEDRIRLRSKNLVSTVILRTFIIT
ncbi:flagellar basal body-associated FliL family protein [Candidatus Liberibacter americanus]|nr:flagellar basal body-associated FliL family protein [Candidatus Liberibacter americanus]